MFVDICCGRQVVIYLVYIFKRFTLFSPSSRPNRICDTRIFNIPKLIPIFLHKAFTVHAAPMWNKLHDTIRDTPSVTSLKHKLRVPRFPFELNR